MKKREEVILSDLGYDEWLEYVFAHTEADTDWHREERYSVGEPSIVARYLADLFKRPEILLGRYTPAEIENGLAFIVGGQGFIEDILFDKKLNLDVRIGLIESMENVFRSIYSIDEIADSGFSCNMWWDCIGYDFTGTQHIAYDPDDAAIQLAMFKTCSRILEMESDAVQLSALHGMGHISHPDTPKVISDWLDRHPDIHPELRAYALKAAKGDVQ